MASEEGRNRRGRIEKKKMIARLASKKARNRRGRIYQEKKQYRKDTENYDKSWNPLTKKPDEPQFMRNLRGGKKKKKSRKRSAKKK